MINKYKYDYSTILNNKDYQGLIKGMKVIKGVSNKIAQFREDYKLFKKFIFKEREHVLTLAEHA